MSNQENEQKKQPQTLAEQMAQAANGDKKPEGNVAPKSLNDGLYQAFGGKNPVPETQPQ